MSQKKKIELEVRNMTCESCATHVTNALKSVDGVEEAIIPGWQSSMATVIVEGVVTDADLASAVQNAGYIATVKNRQALDEVTKPGSPKSSNGRDDGDYDLMVIGGGSAGFAAAIKGAELGYKVALVETSTIGGTCVNIGCVPSKTLIRSMELYHLAGNQRFNCVETMQGSLNWSQVIDHKDQLVEDLRKGKYSDVLEAYPEISYIESFARLTGKNGVEIDGQPYSPSKIVIATGAKPWVPPIPGLKEAGYLDSTVALDLKELPKSMIVLGANAVGLEIAQTYARAGTDVTVIELMPRIAPFEDDEISSALEEYLSKKGLRIVTGFQTTKVKRGDGRYILSSTQNDADIRFEADQLLVATGRRPNTDGLGLTDAGVSLGARGEILVDDQLRTSNPDIFAAGDVTEGDMFVYVAAYGGQLAVENALTEVRKVYDSSYIAKITFTDPLIASAGLTEAQAIEKGYEVKVSTIGMEHIPRALATREV